MFDDEDPLLARVRDIALGLPEAIEKISHGRPTFCAPKMFAVYGGSRKNPDGPMIRYAHALLVKVDDSERPALQQDARFFYPAYLGPFGWLGLDFDAGRRRLGRGRRAHRRILPPAGAGAAGPPPRRQ